MLHGGQGMFKQFGPFVVMSKGKTNYIINYYYNNIQSIGILNEIVVDRFPLCATP